MGRRAKAAPATPAEESQGAGGASVAAADVSAAQDQRTGDAATEGAATPDVSPANPASAASDAGDPFAAAGGGFETLRLDAIRESEWNHRRVFDQAALEELAASIRAQGVLQPLTVRPLAVGSAEHTGQAGAPAATYELIIGARRFRAARLAGLAVVPCLVRPMTDQAMVEAQISENLQRADVTAIEEAAGYEMLRTKFGYSVDAIALKIGKSRRYVYDRLTLGSNLCPEARALADAGHLTASHLVELARLPHLQQRRALTYLCEVYGGGDTPKVEDLVNGAAEGGVSSVRALLSWVADRVHRSLSGAGWKMDDSSVGGDCVACRDCHKRSDYELGSTRVDGRAKCLDPVCFEARVEGHVRRAAEAARAEHGDKLVLAHDHGESERLAKTVAQGAKVVPHWMLDRKSVTETTKGAVPVLDVATGQVGWAKLTASFDAQEHNAKRAEQQRRENAERRREQRVRWAAYRLVLRQLALEVTPTEVVLRALAGDVLGNGLSDACAREVLAALGQEPAKDAVKHLRKHMAKHAAAALTLLAGVQLFGATREFVQSHQTKSLKAVAEVCGVEWAEVEKAAREEEAKKKGGKGKAAGKGKRAGAAKADVDDVGDESDDQDE